MAAAPLGYAQKHEFSQVQFVYDCLQIANTGIEGEILHLPDRQPGAALVDPNYKKVLG